MLSRCKTANVCGVFKNGKKSDPISYRPVSLTYSTTRVLDQVMKRFDHNNILTDCQYGFRSKDPQNFNNSYYLISLVLYN